ncbi:MAG: KpsF/GutQ family sugar-phosphate isomerase [Alphaproteobacteria bacterium]
MRNKPIPATKNSDLASMERVLRLEAEGLRALAAACDAKAVEAIDLLSAVAGRIVVTGMGKSGHIARKIAATLASVGTPAIYVHPGEASHGDLGMIAHTDAILALSNSGETVELADMITYARRFSIPLIGITSAAGSELADQADVALVLPPSVEACPLGLAPMTSTTMMLALGDALAVALLERKGFSAEDFQVLHPGGKLGRGLTRVSEIMHRVDDTPLAELHTSMADALIVMTEKGFGCVGAIDDRGRLVGIVTDGDLRRHMAPNLLARPVGEIMTANPKTIRAKALAAEALGYMNTAKVTNLFVVENAKPIGLVRMHDCLRIGVA